MIDSEEIINFLIVGTQKGGTTALDHYLRSHKNIQMANIKEVHFFDTEQNFKGEINYNEYHQNFSNKHTKIRGECTPIYMYWHDSMRRIYEYNADMKIIAVLRNPTERAFSHWNMEREKGAEKLPFNIAINTEIERCREALPLQHRVFSYVDRGFYSEQIRRIWRFFPKNQTLFLKQDELKADLQPTLQKISTFLDINPFDDLEAINVHSRNYVSTLSNTDRHYLNNIFQNEVKELERILGWDCSEWRKEETFKRLWHLIMK